jgi:hypothetical protein
MNNTVIRMSIQRMVCTDCGAEANASCNCGVSYVAKSVRAAEAVKANPNKSNRSIAAEIGVDKNTVRAARSELSGEFSPEERIRSDGRSFSLRQRIVDDPDIPPKMAEEAAATGRRRIFLRCAEDAARKAEQGAGLKDAKASEIDDVIMTNLNKTADAWASLRDEILSRKERSK